MPYSEILSRGFEIVRRNRALWIIGMLYAFFGGGGGGGGSGNFNQSFDGSNGGPSSGPDIPPWLTTEFVVTAAIVIGVIAVLLGIVFFVLRVTAFTGLVHGTHEALNAEVSSVRSLWGAGWSAKGRRIMGLRLLLAIPSIIMIVIALIAFGATLLPLIMASIEQGDMNESAMATMMGGFFAGFCVFFCLIAFTVLVQFVLNMAGNYASRFIIIDGDSIGEGWRQGWAMFREHILESVVMSFILGIIGAVIGFIIAIPTTIIALAIVLPFAFSGGFENLMTIPVPLLVIGGIFGGLVLGLIGAVLAGPLLAYNETVWTLVYRRYRGLEVAAPSVAPAPSMA